nr:MAG TPA: hypothetical protein [Bacteriophage sp.]
MMIFTPLTSFPAPSGAGFFFSIGVLLGLLRHSCYAFCIPDQILFLSVGKKFTSTRQAFGNIALFFAHIVTPLIRFLDTFYTYFFVLSIHFLKLYYFVCIDNTENE